jgi:hypothetical protein
MQPNGISYGRGGRLHGNARLLRVVVCRVCRSRPGIQLCQSLSGTVAWKKERGRGLSFEAGNLPRFRAGKVRGFEADEIRLFCFAEVLLALHRRGTSSLSPTRPKGTEVLDSFSSRVSIPLYMKETLPGNHFQRKNSPIRREGRKWREKRLGKC